MVMRRAATSNARVRPIGHHFGIHRHLIVKPEQRDIGEIFEDMVADRPGEALPFVGLGALRQGVIVFVNEFILKVTPYRQTGVAAADPVFDGPPRDDVGVDAALH